MDTDPDDPKSYSHPFFVIYKPVVRDPEDPKLDSHPFYVEYIPVVTDPEDPKSYSHPFFVTYKPVVRDPEDPELDSHPFYVEYMPVVTYPEDRKSDPQSIPILQMYMYTKWLWIQRMLNQIHTHYTYMYASGYGYRGSEIGSTVHHTHF